MGRISAGCNRVAARILAGCAGHGVADCVGADEARDACGQGRVRRAVGLGSGICGDRNGLLVDGEGARLVGHRVVALGSVSAGCDRVGTCVLAGCTGHGVADGIGTNEAGDRSGEGRIARAIGLGCGVGGNRDGLLVDRERGTRGGHVVVRVAAKRNTDGIGACVLARCTGQRVVNRVGADRAGNRRGERRVGRAVGLGRGSRSNACSLLVDRERAGYVGHCVVALDGLARRRDVVGAGILALRARHGVADELLGLAFHEALDRGREPVGVARAVGLGRGVTGDGNSLRFNRELCRRGALVVALALDGDGRGARLDVVLVRDLVIGALLKRPVADHNGYRGLLSRTRVAPRTAFNSHRRVALKRLLPNRKGSDGRARVLAATLGLDGHDGITDVDVVLDAHDLVVGGRVKQLTADSDFGHNRLTRVDRLRRRGLGALDVDERRRGVGVVIRKPQRANADVGLHVRDVVGPLRRLDVALRVLARTGAVVAAVVVVVLAGAIAEVGDLDVVHDGRGLDVGGHLLEHTLDAVEGPLVVVVLELDLCLEIIVLPKGLVNRSLVLFGSVIVIIANTLDEVTFRTPAVTYVSEITVAVGGAHRVVEVPQGAGIELVALPRAVAVEENRARADVVALDVLVHEVHLREALNVDVVGVVLTLGVVAGVGANRIPSVLKPRLDLGGNTLHILGTLVNDTVDRQQVVAHLFYRNEVV